MADLSSCEGSEYAELKKWNDAVIERPDDFQAWEMVIGTAESLEGGLNRNSNPNSINATRVLFDKFLARFPLLFAYWKKYADLEFSIAGAEAAEMVYERGVASISNSVDLWTNYCGFKLTTTHDLDLVRELFERAVPCVGLDYMAHPFWDKYIESEERAEAADNIFAILQRIITIPMHQYARYFERFRQLAQTRPIAELVPTDILNQFRNELATDPAASTKTEVEFERDMRTRIDAHHMEIYKKTAAETNRRWAYEQGVKRPFFHVTDLDPVELANWDKYLDYEEVNGSSDRIRFLYERCIVTCAHEDKFWFRYARWMSKQNGAEQELRNIYQRACCLYVPIARPSIRLWYALFEEMVGRVDVAHAIHEAILLNLPGHVPTIESWANLAKRQAGVDAAMNIYRQHVESSEVAFDAKGALVAKWARLLWKFKRDLHGARALFQRNVMEYSSIYEFWAGYLEFEMAQPTADAASQIEITRQVHNAIVQKSKLSQPEIKQLTGEFMVYLLQNGGKDTAKEFFDLDLLAEFAGLSLTGDAAHTIEPQKEGFNPGLADVFGKRDSSTL